MQVTCLPDLQDFAREQVGVWAQAIRGGLMRASGTSESKGASKPEATGDVGGSTLRLQV